MPVTISGTTGIGTPGINATGNIQAAGNVIGTGVCPIGVVLPFALATTPTGWLRCDGTIIPTSGTFQSVDAALLQTLRGLLGTTYGATGQLPNLQGQFIRGLTTNLSTASRDPLSASRVNLIGSIQNDVFKSHNHGGITGDDSPDHSHQYTRPLSVGDNDRGGSSSSWSIDSNQTVSTGGASTRHQHSISSQGDLETRPVNIALLYCIKY
jgi:microcystin-dependent protein